MKQKTKIQKKKTRNNRAECFVTGYLNEFRKKENIKFIRQKMFLGKIFDFRFPYYGIGLEVDGSSHECEHKKEKDTKYDKFLLDKYGVITYRVKNWNKGGVYTAMCEIVKAVSWEERKYAMGLDYDVNKIKKLKDQMDIVGFCKNYTNVEYKQIPAQTMKKNKIIAFEKLFG